VLAKERKEMRESALSYLVAPLLCSSCCVCAYVWMDMCEREMKRERAHNREEEKERETARARER